MRLMIAAEPILRLLPALREAKSYPDIQKTRGFIDSKLALIEKLPQLSADEKKSAHYLLCASVDEAVLSNMDSTDHTWSRQTLLNEHHHDSLGGEKFYQHLEYALAEPKKFLNLLLLGLALLKIGYQGMLFAKPQRREQWISQLQAASWQWTSGKKPKKHFRFSTFAKYISIILFTSACCGFTMASMINEFVHHYLAILLTGVGNG